MAALNTKVNVKVNIGNNKRVSVKPNSTNSNIYLSSGAFMPPSGRIDTLVDVDASNKSDGSTLVYNSQSDKYEVKPLDLENVTGDLDSGTF